MENKINGNLLLVSNYPSDTKYAWWLMEHFWKTQAVIVDIAGFNTFLAFPEITTLSTTIQNSPITAIELCIPWSSGKEKNKVRQFIRDNQIRYIYFTDQPYLNTKYGSMRLAGAKRIIIHDHTPGDRPPVNGVKGLIKSITHSMPWISADRVFCVSKLMQTRNIENARIPEHKCIVVQNGIQPIACQETDKTNFRASMGIPPDSVVVLTTGRAHPYKRFDFIIECASALRKLEPEKDIIFLLVGDGPAMPKLKKLVQTLKLENTVHLLGFRGDIQNLLCHSDIALHAALGEGFSLSILEYMSAGLPVLVPDIPSVSQAISNHKTGYIYPTDESAVVASHTLRLAVDNQLRLKMGKAAKIDADTKYTLKQCTKSFITEITNTYD